MAKKQKMPKKTKHDMLSTALGNAMASRLLSMFPSSSSSSEEEEPEDQRQEEQTTCHDKQEPEAIPITPECVYEFADTEQDIRFYVHPKLYRLMEISSATGDEDTYIGCEGVTYACLTLHLSADDHKKRQHSVSAINSAVVTPKSRWRVDFAWDVQRWHVY